MTGITLVGAKNTYTYQQITVICIQVGDFLHIMVYKQEFFTYNESVQAGVFFNTFKIINKYSIYTC